MLALIAPEGKATSDRRLINPGALTWRENLPLMFRDRDTHGAGHEHPRNRACRATSPTCAGRPSATKHGSSATSHTIPTNKRGKRNGWPGRTNCPASASTAPAPNQDRDHRSRRVRRADRLVGNDHGDGDRWCHPGSDAGVRRRPPRRPTLEHADGGCRDRGVHPPNGSTCPNPTSPPLSPSSRPDSFTGMPRTDGTNATSATRTHASPHPTSPTGYARFNRRTITCDDGSEVLAGNISMGIGHAPLNLSAAKTVDHYDHTEAVVAYGRMIDGRDRPVGVRCCPPRRARRSGRTVRPSRPLR